MINDFLAYLDNMATPPDQTSAPVVIWPSFVPRVVTGPEAALREVLIGANLPRSENFMRCVQLADLVAESPFQDVIVARDPRVTYTKAALRSLFALQGFAVQSPSVVEVMFTALPGTPEIGRWFLRVVSAAAGDGVLSVLDDRGGTGTVAFTYASDTSSLITFPGLDGAVTLYGAIAAGQYWEISFQQQTEPWVQVALRSLGVIQPLSFLSPRLGAAFRTAPLALDRLAAVVAGLGGGQ